MIRGKKLILPWSLFLIPGIGFLHGHKCWAAEATAVKPAKAIVIVLASAPKAPSVK